MAGTITKRPVVLENRHQQVNDRSRVRGATQRQLWRKISTGGLWPGRANAALKFVAVNRPLKRLGAAYVS